MNKSSIKNLIIENMWLNNLVTALKKGCEVDEKTFKILVNSSQPEITKEYEAAIDKKCDDIIAEVTKDEENKEEAKDGEETK